MGRAGPAPHDRSAFRIAPGPSLPEHGEPRTRWRLRPLRGASPRARVDVDSAGPHSSSFRRRSRGDATMVGLITERDLEQADEAFPGIVRFFESLSLKPRTFLQLVALFQQWSEPIGTVGLRVAREQPRHAAYSPLRGRRPSTLRSARDFCSTGRLLEQPSIGRRGHSDGGTSGAFRPGIQSPRLAIRPHPVSRRAHGAVRLLGRRRRSSR
jgi:hypothetical protein